MAKEQINSLTSPRPAEESTSVSLESQAAAPVGEPLQGGASRLRSTNPEKNHLRQEQVTSLSSIPTPIRHQSPRTPPLPDMTYFDSNQQLSSAAHRRRTMTTTSALSEYEADLTSKDRIKQKEAIKQILASKVRSDWKFDASAPLSPTIVEFFSIGDEGDWAERAEWESNASESNGEQEDRDSGFSESKDLSTKSGPINGVDPFRFDNPEGVGDLLRKSAESKKLRRRRRMQEEMKWNEGARCFVHRRNAWTCARHVRRSRSASIFLPSQQITAPDSSTEEDREDVDLAALQLQIPLAPPILPPDTPMRKGINERAYGTIYDKVIMQSQTPFCPINLSIVVKSCVEGWKRDGEWPPKGDGMADIPTLPGGGSLARAKGRRASVGRMWANAEKGEKGLVRRSLQKVLGVVNGKGKEPDTAGLGAAARK